MDGVVNVATPKHGSCPNFPKKGQQSIGCISRINASHLLFLVVSHKLFTHLYPFPVLHDIQFALSHIVDGKHIRGICILYNGKPKGLPVSQRAELSGK